MIVYPGAKVEIHGGSNVNAQTAMETCGHGYFQQFISSFGNGVVAVVIRENNTVEAIPVEQLRFIEPDIYAPDKKYYKEFHPSDKFAYMNPRIRKHNDKVSKGKNEPYKCTDTDTLKCLICGETYNGKHECKGK